MKTTVNFLDEIKVKHGIKSNYALAKLMEQTDTAVSRWMHGKNTLSDDHAILAAKLLELDPAFVVACIHAERAKPTEEKKLWERIAAIMQTKEAAGFAAFLAVVAFMPLVNLDSGHFNIALVGLTSAASIRSNCILCQIDLLTYWPLFAVPLALAFAGFSKKI